MSPPACPACGTPFAGHERVPPSHIGSKRCRANARARELFAAGLVPYPVGHSLPTGFPIRVEQTRAAYSLRDIGKIDDTLSKEGVEQHWAPVWARCVTEVFALRIDALHESLRTRTFAANDELHVALTVDRLEVERDEILARALADDEFAASIEAAWRLDGLVALLAFFIAPKP